jgi:hypothetical protein
MDLELDAESEQSDVADEEIGSNSDEEFLANVAKKLKWAGASYVRSPPPLDGTLVNKNVVVVQPGFALYLARVTKHYRPARAEPEGVFNYELRLDNDGTRDWALLAENYDPEGDLTRISSWVLLERVGSPQSVSDKDSEENCEEGESDEDCRGAGRKRKEAGLEPNPAGDPGLWLEWRRKQPGGGVTQNKLEHFRTQRVGALASSERRLRKRTTRSDGKEERK